MQFTTLLIGTVAALATGTSASGGATVHNKCDFPIFVRAVANGGVGPTTSVNKIPARVGIFFDGADAHPQGAAISIGKQKSLESSLTLEYTPSNGQVFYDLSNNAGNPFSGFRNKLIPAAKGCPKFNCAPGHMGCYSSGANPKTKACKETALKAVICA